MAAEKKNVFHTESHWIVNIEFVLKNLLDVPLFLYDNDYLNETLNNPRI